MELSVGEWRDASTRGFVGVVQDITERKKAEEDAERHRRELTRVLRLATMGELAAGLAHDVSQPLTAAINTLQACVTRLRSSPAGTAPVIPLLERASEEVLRAGRIVRNARELVLNRRPRRERLDLRQVVKTAAAVPAREIEANRITLHLRLGRRALPVDGVRIQLEQMVLNLVQNAIDALRAVPWRSP